MTHNDNSIGGSIASVGTYLLSINQINAYASLFLGLLSGASSIYTIINIYHSKKRKMKNRKTTIFGLLAAISGYFATAGTGKVQVIAQAIAGLSTFLLGNAAADSKKDN